MALVEIRDVHKSFQRDTQRIDVFTGITLDVDEGGFLALMGPSGSGKSTLLNLIAGLDKPTKGTVRVAGSEVSAMTPGQLALGVVGLEDRMHHYPRQLSGGQEQRVSIARAIVADPTVILLDEPTGQLDAKSSQEVLTLLRRLNDEFRKTIVIVTHDMHAADRAKTVLHLEKGELVESAPAASLRSGATAAAARTS